MHGLGRRLFGLRMDAPSSQWPQPAADLAPPLRHPLSPPPRAVGEIAKQLFIPSGQMPNIKGLVLAGAAELKNELVTSGLLDPRLCTIILKSVDTSYGGENGFNQAIALAADALSNVKFTEERALVQRECGGMGFNGR